MVPVNVHDQVTAYVRSPARRALGQYDFPPTRVSLQTRQVVSYKAHPKGWVAMPGWSELLPPMYGAWSKVWLDNPAK